VLLVVLAVIAVFGTAPVAASANPLQTLSFKGMAPSSGGGNLVDHGGPVLSVSDTYAIFWGSASG
jgi:hypothetical protein